MPGRPKSLTPGRVYEFEIDLGSISNVLLKDRRIRLEVSSSNFPRFDRNLDTGKNAADSASLLKAANTIVHDATHQSALIPSVGSR